MRLLQRWRFAGGLAVRDIRLNAAAAVWSVVAMAIPVSAVVATAVAARNMVPETADGTAVDSWWAVGMVAVAAQFAILALVLVGAMVAAAMIVSVRRNERLLALLSALGAEPRVLGRLMSARGIILGAMASVTAVVVGFAVGIAILAGSGRELVSVDAVSIVVVAFATIGVGWLASLVAAVRASGIDVSTVMRDSPRLPRSHRRRARSGLVVAAWGLAALVVVGVLGFVGQSLSAWWLSGLLRLLSGMLAPPAAITILVGAVLAFPALVRWVARLPAGFAGASGLAARIAARDAERSGARSGAAAASIMLVTFLVGGYLTFFAVSDVLTVADHDWQMQRDQAAVDLVVQGSWNPIEREIVADPDAVAAAVSDGVDATQVRVLAGVLGPFWGTPVDDFEGYSGRQTMSFPPGGLPLPQTADDGVCERPFAETGLSDALCTPVAFSRFELSPTRPSIWVGDVADLALMMGDTPDARTRSALEAGEVVVLDPRYLAADDTVTIQWWGASQFVPEDETGEFLPTGVPLKSAVFDGVTVPMEHRLGYGIFMTSAAAESAGLAAVPARVLAQAPFGLTYEQVNSVDLSAFSGDLFLEAEMGPSIGDRAWYWGAVLLAVGLVSAIAIASIGLSRAEGRQIDRTIAVLGAARGLRRRINGWYALFVVGIGAVVGTLCGALTVAGNLFALWSPLESLPAIPFGELGILALGVPIFVALTAFLLPVGARSVSNS